MAQNGSSGDERSMEAPDIIKKLFMKAKPEQIEAWPMPEMVGYYNDDASLPIASVQTIEEAHRAVKKVVCSPDLPEFPSASTPQADQVTIHCPICNKMLTSKAAFQAHQRTHSKDNEDPYRCNICSKTFAVPARLTRHYRTHTGEKPFRCEFCNKSFSVKENLSVHRRIHTKERPYKCEVCSRAFEHSGKLHRHMRIHTGERPHKCNVCAKTFIQSGQLVIHMRTHTGEKPYVCTVCQKGFTCSKQLKVHSRTHTGEKPYSCEICGKSFGYNHVLKLHQVAHYGEKVYKCTICNDTFNSKKSMESHIKSHSDSAPTAPTPPASSSSESSCSSSSDKESRDLPPQEVPPISYDSDVRYYIYPRDQHSPGYSLPPTSASTSIDLLAVAASMTERQDLVFTRHPEVITALRPPAFFSSPSVEGSPLDNLSEGLRNRHLLEAVLAIPNNQSEEETPLTPPSSNPASPSRSLSPDPEMSLPPRKRSKVIAKAIEEEKSRTRMARLNVKETTSPMKSMQSVQSMPVQPMQTMQYTSVIQYARAS